MISLPQSKPASPPQSGGRAAFFVLLGSIGVQSSSAISASMFDALGSPAVSSLRLVFAAVVLLAFLRPTVRGHSRSAWSAIAFYGIVMAAMNLLLYKAIEYLPLGVAVTLDFLGPAVVALVFSRRIREAAWALLALGGVILIAGPGGHFNMLGFAFGIGAGLCFAFYTLLAEKVGKADDSSVSSLALSVAIAALASLPFGLPKVTEVSGPQWGLLALSGVIGVAIPYFVDTLAARISSARVVGTLFAIDPAMGTLIGWLALGEQLGWLPLLGIACVALAGAGVTWFAAKPPGPLERVPTTEPTRYPD
ncbi:EamA family transporter [Glutamicibacter arilaitensis]|uniref:EamA family transporter n=1 Tax=Glutamicibacter arilaitensis TaxID=256701 RepID=UPI00384C8939